MSPSGQTVRTLLRLGRESKQIRPRAIPTSTPSSQNCCKRNYSSVLQTEGVEEIAMPAFNLVNGLNDIEKQTVNTRASQFSALLNLPQVQVKNREEVEKKLNRILNDGADKLMVISDFDFTLSRYRDDDGTMCWTTHGVFDNLSNLVDPTLFDKFNALKNKYFPIEFCSKLTAEEKTPHMESWWGQSHQHIINAGFQESMIFDFVKTSKIILKDGSEEMMQVLDNSNIPFIVFSAGIGNIIEMFFKHQLGCVPQNTHIISNMMKFNEQGTVDSFSEPLIHTFCKNSTVIRKDPKFYEELKPRSNVILLGDSMGDIHMAVGTDKDGPTLKIGFLNDNVDKLLDHYMDVYDIVLVLDHTMEVAKQIIDQVVAKN